MKVEGCQSCFDSVPLEHVYTGQKIWPAYAAYGKDKTIEKNHEWIKNMETKAARNRRETTTISGAAFDAIISGQGIRR